MCPFYSNLHNMSRIAQFERIIFTHLKGYDLPINKAHSYWIKTIKITLKYHSSAQKSLRLPVTRVQCKSPRF